MLTLPPVDLPRWFRSHTRLGRDHYIRVDTVDYSVHPLAIGKRIQVSTDTDEVIAVFSSGGAVVARHPRCWAKHQTITDPDHARTAKALRGDFRHHLASQARQAAATGDLIEVEQSQLDTYEQAFTSREDHTDTDESEGEVF